MSRRKVMAQREPSGKVRRAARDPNLLSPCETKRLLDAAALGLRSPEWGTAIGRLFLTGKISPSQFAAAKRWSELTVNFATACQSPRGPRTVQLDASGGMSADPDSAIGVKEARRHERATAAYLEGRQALRLAGAEAERVVGSVCEHDHAPAGVRELDALRVGLQALAAWWSARPKAPPRASNRGSLARGQ